MDEPDARRRAFRAVPGGGRDADQPRPRRLLARPRARARRRRRGRARPPIAEGAKHQTSFYGQLAAEKAGVAADPRLAGAAPVPDWRGQAFLRASVVEAAAFLDAAGTTRGRCSSCATPPTGMPAEERAALAQMAIDAGRPHVGVRLAKDAAAKGMVLPDQYYPLHDIAGGGLAGADRIRARHRPAGERVQPDRGQLRRRARPDAADARHGAGGRGQARGRLRRPGADQRSALQRPARNRVSRADVRGLRTAPTCWRPPPTTPGRAG